MASVGTRNAEAQVAGLARGRETGFTGPSGTKRGPSGGQQWAACVKGGFEAGTRCFNALRLFKRMVNLGDAKSLACHPASTTHRQLTPEEQENVGVTPEMLRLSVGIEHIDDIIEDLAQALDKAAA